MKKTIITLSLFVLFIVVFNVVRYNIESNRKQAFIDSFKKINGSLIGKVVEIKAFQQDVSLLKMKLYRNEIGDLDLSDLGFIYLGVHGQEAELAVRWGHYYEIGDSLIVNPHTLSVKNYREGEKVESISFDSLFIYRRSPVYYELSWKRTL